MHGLSEMMMLSMAMAQGLSMTGRYIDLGNDEHLMLPDEYYWLTRDTFGWCIHKNQPTFKVKDNSYAVDYESIESLSMGVCARLPDGRGVAMALMKALGCKVDDYNYEQQCFYLDDGVEDAGE